MRNNKKLHRIRGVLHNNSLKQTGFYSIISKFIVSTAEHPPLTKNTGDTVIVVDNREQIEKSTAFVAKVNALRSPSFKLRASYLPTFQAKVNVNSFEIPNIEVYKPKKHFNNERFKKAVISFSDEKKK